MASALHEMGTGRLDGGRHESSLAGNCSFRTSRQSEHSDPPKHDGYRLCGLYGDESGVRDLQKPIELYIYSNELHVINQPKHRLEIYERNVDCVRFG